MDYYAKSGRQPFWKLLLTGFLFMMFGNLLCTIVTISTAPFMIMFIPSAVLFLDKICGWYFDMTFVHRIIDGMVYPLSLMIVPDNSIDGMQVFVPFIYMLCYAGIPAATHLGYYFGYTQKFNKDDIMYE